EKRAENVDPEAQAISNPGAGKRKKKHHGEASTQQVATPITDDERPRKKRQRVEKKDTHADNEFTADSTDNIPRVESPPSAKPKREKRPKKPKDKTTKLSAVKAASEEASASVLDDIHIADISVPYTNPLTDASLPELSQRGLAYAYQYAQHVSLPSDTARTAQQAWKFNKGRQNWIIRNVTDPAVIPDSYLALTMVYVDSIKGGARDALKKACKTTTKEAKAAVQPEPDRQKPSGKAEEAESDKSTPKKVAFAAVTDGTTTLTPVNEEKRKRAKKILRVLRGKVGPQDV
ncbi:hypothetical protein FRC09_012097, partial [Ceratobasidium sp. 395]